MFDDLQIYDSRERVIVGLADVALRAVTAPFRAGRALTTASPPARILVLRLERIGDLLMTFDALALLRASLPSATIDLVVGSWNEPLAHAMAVADSVDVLDAPWLARDQPGSTWPRLLSHARGWRRRGYDLAINLEPDIRSNLMLEISGARRRVGFYTGGGGALLTDAVAYDPRAHTSENASRVIGLALPAAVTFEPRATAVDVLSPGLKTPPASRRLQLSEAARERAARLLEPAAGSRHPVSQPVLAAEVVPFTQVVKPSPFIGIHASGGRPIKQWHLGRLAEVATALGREYGATIVLTGTPHDAAIVGEVQAAIPPDVRVLNLSGQADLLDLAAVIERLAVFVTGDTGPMHLAAAVGTPLVAIFGPSDPARYAPRTPTSHVVRIDLWCSPCNRIRLPPERCRGHVPDCLDGISVDRVLKAVRECCPPGG